MNLITRSTIPVGAKKAPAIDRRPGRSGHLRPLTFLLVGLLGLVCSLVPSFVAAEPAGALTTLFVSAGGSDANPCSAAAPCATITHALSGAGPGATIEVAGTVDDNVSDG